MSKERPIVLALTEDEAALVSSALSLRMMAHQMSDFRVDLMRMSHAAYLSTAAVNTRLSIAAEIMPEGDFPPELLKNMEDHQ